MANAYEVHPYSIDRLKNIIKEKSGKTSPFIIDMNFHAVYFEEYFGAEGVNAKTIVVEQEYVDRDFLEDYSSYYVRCFADYRRICSRLHFFDFAFTQRQFTNAVSGRGIVPLISKP